MPRVSIRAVEHALEAKKFPHRVDESVWFEASANPNEAHRSDFVHIPTTTAGADETVRMRHDEAGRADADS
jgi:hypothetical protein